MVLSVFREIMIYDLLISVNARHIVIIILLSFPHYTTAGAYVNSFFYVLSLGGVFLLFYIF